MTNGTTQIPSSNRAVSEESSGLGMATKIVLGVCGFICIMIIGFLAWSIATRDSWEFDNTSRISAQLEEADRLQQSDPLTAYKIYDAVLKVTKQHKITGELFAQKIANAEKSRAVTYQKVQDIIRAEEAEKKQSAEKEARRVEAEKQRIAEEEKRKRAAEEAQRIAEENQRAEEKSARKQSWHIRKSKIKFEMNIVMPHHPRGMR